MRAISIFAFIAFLLSCSKKSGKQDPENVIPQPVPEILIKKIYKDAKVSQIFIYDDNNLLTRVEVYNTTGAASVLDLRWEIKYDANGFISQSMGYREPGSVLAFRNNFTCDGQGRKKETAHTFYTFGLITGNANTTYSYNNAGQLVEELVRDKNKNPESRTEYAYAANGSLSSEEFFIVENQEFRLFTRSVISGFTSKGYRRYEYVFGPRKFYDKMEFYSFNEDEDLIKYIKYDTREKEMNADSTLKRQIRRGAYIIPVGQLEEEVSIDMYEYISR